MRNLKRVLAITALAGLLWGCDPSGKHPFLLVQLCVVDKQGLSTFTNLMRDLARTEKMYFVDGSDNLLRSYKVFRETDPKFRYAEPVTNIGIERDDMMGLSAGNIREQSYNIVIGFNFGSNSSGSQEFAQTVVGALKQHWPVETVPEGTGAFPLARCNNEAKSIQK